LVGIAGEDDLDAPDPLTEPSDAVGDPPNPRLGGQTGRKPPNGSIHKLRQPEPLLAVEPSAALRDQLIAEKSALRQATILPYGPTDDCRPRTRSRPTTQAP
jgi:hypothetical protein